MQARMAPSADQRLLFDQGRRHLPGRPGRISKADTSGAGRDPGDRLFRGSIDTTGQFSLNNNWVWGWDGTLVTDKMVLQDYGLRTYFARDGSVQVRRPRDRHAALSDRPRRAQLFRCARDVLLRPRGERRAEPASDRPSGRRLPEQARAAAVRRRTDLPGQHHQPVARQRRLRPDHADGVQHRAVRPADRRSDA